MESYVGISVSLRVLCGHLSCHFSLDVLCEDVFITRDE